MMQSKKSNLLADFGHRIKTLRKARDMTQEQFADKMGVDGGQSFISKVERGEKMFSIENILRAAEVLSIHPAILLSEQPLTEENLEMLTNLFKLFQNGDDSKKKAVKDLLQAYTK